jgi:transposase-like protein
MLKNIYGSDTRKEALREADKFKDVFSPKYPKAVSSLLDQIDNLLTYFDFPAHHWTVLRTSNPIESLFSTVRSRTNVTRGKLGRVGIGTMLFKLAQTAAKRMHSIPRADLLRDVADGKVFQDGEATAQVKRG